MTLFYKVVVPSLWIAGFFFATIAMALSGVGPAPIFAVMTAVGGTLLLLYLTPLKQVTMTAEGLAVGNYRKTIVIPYEDIAEVKENKLVNLRTTTIELRRPSEFGEHIQFMPWVWLSLAFWRDHPANVALARRLAETRSA